MKHFGYSIVRNNAFTNDMRIKKAIETFETRENALLRLYLFLLVEPKLYNNVPHIQYNSIDATLSLLELQGFIEIDNQLHIIFVI